MKKKVLTVALLGATTSLMALGGEFAYLYKDPRIMGMGGANVAVGAYSTALFSNPAGLTDIKKKHGFVVDILGVGAGVSSKTLDFFNDVNDATEDEITDIIAKYSGEHFHFGVDNYSSISKNSDAFAWSVGLLAATDLNMESHASGAYIESSSRGYGGLIFGVAKPFETEYGRVDIGIGAKYIMQQSYEGKLYINDLTNSNDIVQTLRDKFEKQSSGFGVDVGLTYHPFERSYWHPAFGVSFMNIGSMGMDDNYGSQPMTVNFGASITPDVSFMNKLVVAVDYVDALNANTIRTYTYSPAGDVTWADDADVDFMKRVRLGVSMGLIDSSLLSTALNVGMYQDAWTGGLNLELALLKFNLASYEEQIGTGSVSIPDRRYVLQLGLGW